MISCSLVEKCQNSRGTWCLHLLNRREKFSPEDGSRRFFRITAEACKLNVNINWLTKGSNTRDGFVSPVSPPVSHVLTALLMTMYTATGSNAKEHLTPRVNHESTSLGLQDPHFWRDLLKAAVNHRTLKASTCRPVFSKKYRYGLWEQVWKRPV